MNLFKAILLVVFAFISCFVMGQDKGNKAREKCLGDDEFPLTDSAFAKMMTEYFAFTIVGTNTPTTGFKVDLNKPTITLTGNIYQNKKSKFIVNLQLIGGLKNDFGQVFSQNKLNGFFKITAGANILLKDGKGIYNADDGEPCEILKQTRKVIEANKNTLLRQADTAITLKILFHEALPATFNDFIIELKKAAIPITIKGDDRPSLMEGDAYFVNLFRGVLIKYGGSTTDADATNYANLQTKLSDKIAFKELDALITDYHRLKNVPEKVTTLQSEYAVEKLKDIWVRKRIWWINVTPFFMNSGTTFFDTTNLKLIDTASLTYGGQISFNVMSKFKASGRFLYWKFGLDLRRVDNIEELSKFEYERQAPINPDGQIRDTKTGSAYKGQLDYGPGGAIFTELYHTPLKRPFLPGYYVGLQYRNGDPWINKNKLVFDFGLLWNVTNNDKDAKNLLSIIPYVSWSNLLTEYKDHERTEKRKTSDLFSVNVRFGIPVNIGK
jgi:hypothetical protein